MNALSVQDLAFSRPSGPVLEGLEFELQPGERVSILGPSGSGKTTLLRLIAGLETPGRGDVLIGGALASSAGRILMPPHARSLGYVFQEAALWPHMRVTDHLRFAMQSKTKASSKADVRKAQMSQVESLLERVGLEGMGQRYPDQLSGGEARRVGLARALASEPACLLMDEPLTNLDHHLRSRMLDTIEGAVAHLGASLIYVTHEPAEASALASRTLRMAQGRLEEGEARQI